MTPDDESCLVNLAGLPHSDQQKRNQSIFHNLLKQPALYSAGIFVDPPWVGDRRASFLERGRRIARVLTPPDRSGVRIVHPAFALPLSANEIVARFQSRLITRRIRALVGARSFWLWINNFDFHSFSIAQALSSSARRVMVDLSDDFTTFRTTDPEGLRRRLSQGLSLADGLIAVNEAVARKFPHPRTLVFGNSTDFENFQKADPTYRLGDVLPKKPGQRIVGFTGGLHRERVDERLLTELLVALPEVRFVFVGYSNDQELVRRLSAYPNVRMFSTVPYHDLGSVIRGFDVAIVPHLDNEFTRGNDLLKVRDYLACGVPVVSTRSSGVDRFGDVLQVVDGVSAFVATVRSLIERTTVHDPGPGLDLTRQSSWSVTVPRLAEWLRHVAASPPRRSL